MSLADEIWALADAEYDPALKRGKLELEMVRSVAPIIYPVTSADVISHLKLPSGSNETDIDKIIKAVTERLEKELNQGFIEQTWKQVQSTVRAAYSLFRRPVLAVETVQYYSTLSDDTLRTVDSTTYLVSEAKDRIRTRSSWPTHRGWKSWLTTFRVGYYDLPASPSDQEKTNAREAVPWNIREAILQWIGHLYENREGQGPELKYEVIAKRMGPIPQNVAALVQIDLDRRFVLR